jgi:tRNA nucleotidyltransferase/poly(A) polymerase
MTLTKEIIDSTLRSAYGEAAYKIVETLTDAGYDSWWVGGSVRDMLMEMIPEDIDIATVATPEQIIALFPKATQTPKALGSVRIPIGKDEFEMTTFREDHEISDGRHPESVTFSDRTADAKRRDFTINALYFQPISRELYDPFEGAADLKEKLIRFIGDPTVRIKHDALRLLRCVRFRALLDGQYHPDTYKALQEQAALVETLSGMRQLQECEKMLMGPHPDIAFEDLWELGILERFLPELHACKGVPQPTEYHHEGDVWNHTMQCLRSFRPEDDIDVRIATLFHDSGKVETFSLKERIRFDEHATASAKIATTALTRLQMPKKRIEKISWIIEHHMMMSAFFEMKEERKGHWYYHPWFPELLRLFYLDIAGTTPSGFDLYNKIIADENAFLDKHPRPVSQLLTGEQVMALRGAKSGSEIGQILNALKMAQESGEIQSKEEAKAFVLAWTASSAQTTTEQ